MFKIDVWDISDRNTGKYIDTRLRSYQGNRQECLTGFEHNYYL